MRAWLLSALGYVLLTTAALAQVGGLSFPGPGPGHSAAASPTIVPGANVAMQSVAFSGTPVSFSGLNGGTNFPANSTVYVGFGNDAGIAATGVTIGGQTATAVAGATDSTNKCQMFRATMPGSSQPDTFATTNTFVYDRVGVASVYFTNITAAPTGTGTETYAGGPPGNTGADPQFAAVLSPTATIPSTGFGWAFVFANAAGILTGNAATWQTTTPSFITASGGDTNSVLNAKAQIASAHTTSALAGGTSWQGKVSGSPTNFNFVACVGAIAVGP